MDKNNLKALKESYIFKNLTDEDIKNSLPALNFIKKEYQKGEIILATGDKTGSFGIIIQGNAHIIQEDYWGRKIIIAEIETSDAFAEVFAILGIKSEVTVVATQTTQVFFINFMKLVGNNNQAQYIHNILMQNILNSTADKNLRMAQKLNYLNKKTIKDKLLTYLSNEALKNGERKFTIPFNRQDLANFLGVDRSALSTEISKLKKDGIIKCNKNVFELLEPEHYI